MKIGIDIGGTKCAVVLGDEKQIVNKISFLTEDVENTLKKIIDAVHRIGEGDAIGISCGGPLDAKVGVIMSPPNLPDWDNIRIVDILKKEFSLPVYLCNDANACALAEWKYGAGVGCKNMVFLTFGTGLGAGLIIDGKLYNGTNGMAGEVGHIRLTDDGPIGFGKAGSFEGYCSGGGISRLGRDMVARAIKSGNPPSFCRKMTELDGVTAKSIAEAATAGDQLAKEIYEISGRMLGRGVAMIIDILNPERVVIGSVFQRAEELLRYEMEKYLEIEALSQSLSVCSVIPALLGDEIGDYAALAVAHEGEKLY